MNRDERLARSRRNALRDLRWRRPVRSAVRVEMGLAKKQVKIRVRKIGCCWFVLIPGPTPDDIPEFVMFQHYTDAFARVQVELTREWPLNANARRWAHGNKF